MTEIMNLFLQMSPKPSEIESPYAKALRPKQDLVCMLLENEHARLTTWLYPLDNGRKNTSYIFRSPADVRKAFSPLKTIVTKLQYTEFNRNTPSNSLARKPTARHSAYQAFSVPTAQHECSQPPSQSSGASC